MRRAALLRGVNLGGRRLIMAELKGLAEGLGFTRVQTLLASGNLVFDSDRPAPEIEAMLETALEQHGLKTDVLVRDRAELAAVLAANPWPEAALDHPSHFLVTFHRHPFSPDALERLASLHPGPERLHAIDRELYMDFRSQQGMRESKLLQAMAKARLPAVATARNWNTVQKLAAMLAD
ncbi:DUF1697 domain-containing protein [Sphingomonas sp. M1-B02]|uniref:DUF1697 domain-containing protein n=1 Tax=Sphingomonas sp. M1-B02 TaxID=3114300 RepID=UPI00223EBEFE|nr:DUF1697 domain-containing protein [Sphingomonas sp. S6-11]UZK65170.1 DUF1697 domain-containing protein [Sphingomonas sp. S6-11]